MRSSLDPHVSVSIISDRQRLKSILYITMMCEFMHQTYVARPVDLSRFVIVRIDRYCVCYAFAIQASLLCRLQRALVLRQEDEDSRSSCGEPHQVVELLFAGEPTPVLHLDSDVVEVLVLVHLFLVVAALVVMVDP